MAEAVLQHVDLRTGREAGQVALELGATVEQVAADTAGLAAFLTDPGGMDERPFHRGQP